MKAGKIMFSLLVAISVLSACIANEDKRFTYEEIKNSTVEHIHGLGYINGQQEIAIATHNGLYKYGQDGWREANGQKHDYMGFQATRDGFFASGHPEKGSNLKNPFGLIKSTDSGASFEQLSFYGENDFHYLAAGYNSNMVYVYNETATNDMEVGLHFSENEGESWTKVKMKGYNSNTLSNLAAHPTKKELLVVGSQDGLFMSNDYGENFTLINHAKMVTFVILNQIGGFYSNFENEQVKLKAFFFDKKDEKNIPLPKEENLQPILYIATNPENPKEIVFMTNNIDIYLTKDEGITWNKLAAEGELLE